MKPDVLSFGSLVITLLVPMAAWPAAGPNGLIAYRAVDTAGDGSGEV